MKTVAVIGAGPSGLVAAKTLLEAGFEVTVYEKNYRVGGIWALDRTSQGGFLSPQTPTNLSRFSVSFTDLDWNTLDLSAGSPSSTQSERENPPMFPQAWKVYKYLESYTRKFIPAERLKLEHEVVTVDRQYDRHNEALVWQVTTKTSSKETSQNTFDHVLIASGVFSGPRPISRAIPSFNPNQSALPIKIIHSSEYRSLDSIFSSESVKRGNILIIGGANSGGEAAATLAMHLSDALWSPDSSRKQDFLDRKIIHVTSRPFYAMPPYLEYESGSRSYMPLDWKFYDVSKRPSGEMIPSIGVSNQQKIDFVHDLIQGIVGGDQSDLGCTALVSIPQTDRVVPYAALTESYGEFVRSGMIEVVAGRVTSLNVTDGLAHAIITHDDSETNLVDIGAIIYATGYTPLPGLNFLSSDVKQKLEYDEKNLRIPIVLDQWQTSNPAVPDLAFAGWYEGPFWPVVEMQARIIAHSWKTGSRVAQNCVEDRETMRELRSLITDRSALVPQYWFTDYPAQMEAMAIALNLQRNDAPFAEREGCPSPARYLTLTSDRAVATNVMKELSQLWHECINNGKFVARAVFRALHGKWTINRRITSADLNFSGTLTGTAEFLPRLPTHNPNATGKTFDLEYLYVESGTFVSASGFTMNATRRYVYRYSETRDELSVWFVTPDRNLEVDYLFHDLCFLKPAEARELGAIVARADHLCVADMYRTEYQLPMKGVALLEFSLTHEVKGPHKDYVAVTNYERPYRSPAVRDV